MAWTNNKSNAGRTPYNVITNWGLRCYSQKVTEKSVILKCSMAKKKQDGEYTKPFYIDVICSFDNCEIAEGDYEKSNISVDGSFGVGEYENKNGEQVSTFTIFATKVTQFNKS